LSKNGDRGKQKTKNNQKSICDFHIFLRVIEPKSRAVSNLRCRFY
jgi:hypothetical protein